LQITVETDRTVVAFYKFLKQHASIPFKLQKPASTPKPESSDSDAKESSDAKENQSSNSDVKDELWRVKSCFYLYRYDQIDSDIVTYREQPQILLSPSL